MTGWVPPPGVAYPRPATVEERATGRVHTGAETAPCVFLGESGCRLAFVDRPRMCRELEPWANGDCRSGWDIPDATREWGACQGLVDDALRQGRLKISAAEDTHMGCAVWVYVKRCLTPRSSLSDIGRSPIHTEEQNAFRFQEARGLVHRRGHSHCHGRLREQRRPAGAGAARRPRRLVVRRGTPGHRRRPGEHGAHSQLRALASSSLSAGESFYLAIKRTELDRRYFLSAYVEQVFPDGVLGGAAGTVGTRVVSFKIQNDKLFLFDASDIHATSDVFDPTLVLEAWPIVTSSDKFNKDKDKDKYILIDPAAGLNRFSLFADYYFQPPQFRVGLVYLQNFKKLADGVAFQEVFTGEATGQIHDFSGTEFNLNRLSGTLGIALREYKEGPGFTTIDPPAEEYFFLSDPRIVPNGGYTVQTPAKWNIHPGMKPIKWTISPYARTLAADPFTVGTTSPER